MDHDVLLHIDGRWRPSADGATLPVVDPATEERIGTVPVATVADLDEALAAAGAGFDRWRRTSPTRRARTMRAAADLLRQRADEIGRLMTLEQGKPLAQAVGEVKAGADTIEWFAEEARRSYGRVVPPRAESVQQLVLQEPVGPVAAFTPWNFPVNQVVRKLGAALAAGCSFLVKAPEETPASPAELIRCFVDAGVPDGVIGLVYGVPADISAHLIPSPVIRKVTFTGSTAVGKQLAALAGSHMKRTTMELGGHAPVLVLDDADVPAAARTLAEGKLRNAGQTCISPTRFVVQSGVHDEFVDAFVSCLRDVQVGPGIEPATDLGPLANDRRVPAIEAMVADAADRGAEVVLGGSRVGSRGYFFEPTVLVGVTPEMRVMNDEPFGPLAAVTRVDDLDEAVAEANRLPYGLAAYAFTTSARSAHRVGTAVESGMVAINHLGLGLPETPFGGVKDSGHGSEGGTEAMEAYLNTTVVTQAF